MSIKLQLDDSTLDATVKAHIESLEKEIESLQAKIKRLEARVEKYQRGMNITKEAREEIKTIAEGLVAVLERREWVELDHNWA